MVKELEIIERNLKEAAKTKKKPKIGAGKKSTRTSPRKNNKK